MTTTTKAPAWLPLLVERDRSVQIIANRDNILAEARAHPSADFIDDLGAATIAAELLGHFSDLADRLQTLGHSTRVKEARRLECLAEQLEHHHLDRIARALDIKISL